MATKRSTKGKSSAKTKKQRTPRDPFVALELSARVRRSLTRATVSQESFCEMMKVSDQTLRNWRSMGMPVEGTEARPRYPLPDALTWALYYRTQLIEDPRPRSRRAAALPPRQITLERAKRWHLWDDFRTDRDGHSWYVLVPLAHDHPMREEQLRRAAAGRPPPPDPVDLEENHSNDEAGDNDERDDDVEIVER